MRRFLTFLALLTLTIPNVALAKPDEGNRQSNGGFAQAGTGENGAVKVAARVEREVIIRGRGPRVEREVIVRGPRGGVRAREFVYRGRSYAAVHRPHYIYPRGYAYRRWHAGQFLPVAFIAAPFFFLEYAELGLRPPPPGYRWVRYGPDVVLVNMRTRAIEDVAYAAIDEDDGY
jgi:Ni/Co efflux regulator RcnB